MAKRRSSGWRRLAAAVVAGMAIGTVMVTPTVAHTPHSKHYDLRYVEETQSAGGEVSGTFSALNVDEGSLETVPNATTATLGGLGRHVADFGTCDPTSATLIECARVTVDAPSLTRALIIATGQMNAASFGGSAFCETEVQVGENFFFVSTTAQSVGSNSQKSFTLAGVTGPLDPGSTAFRLTCNQGSGLFTMDQIDLSVVLLSGS